MKKILHQLQKSLDETIYIIIKIYLINLDIANLQFFKIKNMNLIIITTLSYNNKNVQQIYNPRQQAQSTINNKLIIPVHLVLISQQVLHGLILHYKQLLITFLQNIILQYQIAIM